MCVHVLNTYFPKLSAGAAFFRGHRNTGRGARCLTKNLLALPCEVSSVSRWSAKNEGGAKNRNTRERREERENDKKEEKEGRRESERAREG